jgi:hypothetical protein
MVKEREIVSWKTLVSKEVKKLKAEGKSAKLQNVLPLVKPIWAEVKKGEHKLYRVASDEEKKLNKKVTKVVKKGKKKLSKDDEDDDIEPGHKGSPSKTRPGKKNFVTRKGSKHYNRDDHYQDDNEEGEEGPPYQRTRKKRKSGKNGKKSKKNKTKCKRCCKYREEIEELKIQLKEQNEE